MEGSETAQQPDSPGKTARPSLREQDSDKPLHPAVIAGNLHF
jgi:hypothetical protein